MYKLLTIVGMFAILALGCDSAPSVSGEGSASATTLASISPANKATATYGVTGMT
jgi:hypothetical protein